MALNMARHSDNSGLVLTTQNYSDEISLVFVIFDQQAYPPVSLYFSSEVIPRTGIT